MEHPWQRYSFEDQSFPYLTGNALAVQCGKIWNFDGFKVNPNKQNNLIFVKTDYIAEFFNSPHVPAESFKMVTHNSDYPIEDFHLPFIEDKRVIHWFAENPAIKHAKLTPLALGIGFAGDAHGDISVFDKVRAENNRKENLFYSNYSLHSNPAERMRCLQFTNLPRVTQVGEGWSGFGGGVYHQPNTHEGYLREMSKAYFAIAPQGHGIDSHRPWEALYVGTIPVVTKNEVYDFHEKFCPMVVLRDWEDFSRVKFSPELYRRLWRGFYSSEDIFTDNYIRRLGWVGK